MAANLYRMFVAMLAIGALSGCFSEDNEDIRQWMEESSRSLKGDVPQIPELKPFPIVAYAAIDAPDPFNPDRLEPERREADTSMLKPDQDRPREQLEVYPLESIDFIGVVDMIKSNEKHALVKVDNVVYQVKVGNHMGQNFGRITEISGADLSLLETVQDPSGQTAGWVEREVVLQLQQGPNGSESNR